MNTLPDDYARCNGRPVFHPPSAGIVSHHGAECADCLRRTTPRPERVWMTAPPALVDGKCPERISP